MSLRTTSRPVPLALRILATFAHGLVFCAFLVAVGVFGWYRLASPDGDVHRWARAPTGEELAAGTVWLDSPIEALVPLIADGSDPYGGCSIHEQRYAQTGKTRSFVEQRGYAYAAARVREPTSRLTFDVPLYSVAIDYREARVLGDAEAREKLGKLFVESPAGDASSPQIGTVRYLESCVRGRPYLFVDGKFDGAPSTFRGVAEVSPGPTMASRRARALATDATGATLVAGVVLYVLLVMFVWTSPFALANFVRRRASLGPSASSARATWVVWGALAAALLFGALVAGLTLGAPQLLTVAIAVDGFTLLGVHCARRRRGLVTLLAKPLARGVVRGGPTVAAPVSTIPSSACELEVHIGKGKSERLLGLWRQPPTITVDLSADGGAPKAAHLEFESAALVALDAPAVETRFAGDSAPRGVAALLGLEPNARYRVREALVAVGEPVCLFAGDTAALRGEPAGAYRGMSAVELPATPQDPVLLFCAAEDDVRARLTRDARRLATMIALCAVGAAAATAGPIYAALLAAR